MAHPSHTSWSAHIDALLLHTYTLRKEPVAVTCHDGTGPVRLFRARFKWVIALVNFPTVPVRAFPERSLDARSNCSGQACPTRIHQARQRTQCCTCHLMRRTPAPCRLGRYCKRGCGAGAITCEAESAACRRTAARGTHKVTPPPEGPRSANSSGIDPVSEHEHKFRCVSFVNFASSTGMLPESMALSLKSRDSSDVRLPSCAGSPPANEFPDKSLTAHSVSQWGPPSIVRVSDIRTL